MSEFRVHQEPDLVSSAVLTRIAVAGLVVAAVGVFVAGALLESTTGALRPDLAGRGGPRAAPETLSQVEQTPIRETRTASDLRQMQLRDLEGWGWVDRKKGLAKIPIDQAMEIVAKAGSR